VHEPLRRHVELFNAGVRSGDFSSMLAQFADDAELVFEGVPVGPFRSREAIATAYRDRPPDDEIEVFDVRERDDEIAAGYAWRKQASVRAGELRITPAGQAIGRLVLTFDERPRRPSGD
jgi:hypothetical protein